MKAGKLCAIYLSERHMSSSVTSKRVCPLLERESETEILPYAPAPWVLRRCRETGFVFLENPPAYEAFEEEFAWEVTSRKESDKRQAAEPLLYAASTGLKKFRRLLKRNKIGELAHAVLRDFPTGQINLLDVGSGWGGLLQNLIASLPPDIGQRCVPYGIELSKQLAQFSNERMAQAGGRCVQDTALNGFSQFPADHFHLIIMSSFLEHEINPLPLLRRCREHLTPGGHVIIKVPNFGCLNRTVRGSRWCGFRWPDHVNYFTPATFCEMVARAGLKIARMNFFDCHPLSDNMYAVVVKPAVPGRA